MDIRKALAVTTALTAVGALAAGTAQAAEAPKLSILGSYEIYFGISDQDNEAGRSPSGTPTYRAAPGTEVNKFGIVNYGEIRFRAEGTTDSGLAWRVELEDVQDEADVRGGQSTDATIFQRKNSTDETWARIEGSWGRLQMGGFDGPADEMYEGSADFVYTGAREHGIFADIGIGADKTNINDSSDNTGLAYITPRISGFRAGYKWVPEEAKGSVLDTTGGGTFHELGVEYQGKIAANELRAAANFTQGPGGGDTTEAWRVSANYTMGAFTIGAGYVDNGEWEGDDTDAHAWDAGVAYNGGAYEVSLTYLFSKLEDGADEEEYSQVVVSAVHNLGGGLSVAGSLYFFEDDFTDAADDTEGWVGLVSTEFRF